MRSDSVWLRDSVVVRMQGDTTVIERIKRSNRYLYRYKVRTDTVVQHDSIRVPYPVERPLSRWEKLRQEVGGIAIGVLGLTLLAVAVYVVAWLARRHG